MKKKNISHARVVLSGEHSVVYGHPALTSQISLMVRAQVITPPKAANKYIVDLTNFFSKYFDLELAGCGIRIESQIPIGSGLSSSTAVASAVFQALAHHFYKPLSQDELFDLLVMFESQFYPVSGMDQATVAYGGLIKFQKMGSGKPSFRPIKTNLFDDKTFFLIDSGKPEESTAEMVAKVRALESSRRDRLVSEIGTITIALIDGVERGVWRSDLLSQNQKILEELGVVGEWAKKMVRQIGAIGGVAKISGAGGAKAGSGILLAYHEDLEKLGDLVEREKWRSWKIGLGE